MKQETDYQQIISSLHVRIADMIKPKVDIKRKLYEERPLNEQRATTARPSSVPEFHRVGPAHVQSARIH